MPDDRIPPNGGRPMSRAARRDGAGAPRPRLAASKPKPGQREGSGAPSSPRILANGWVPGGEMAAAPYGPGA